MRNLPMYLTIAMGVCAVFLFQKLSGLYFFGLLISAVIFIIAKKANRMDRRFLIAMIVLIFVSRFILSLFVMEARGTELTQDEGLYSKKALLIAYEMKGGRGLEALFDDYFNDYEMGIKHYGYNTYTYILALFYSIFGYQIQAARLINVFFSIIVFLCIFYMARRLFSPKAARIASGTFAVFPSIALWSTMIGVDMITLVCVSLYMLSLLKLFDKFDIRWLLLAAAALLAVESIRGHIAAVLICVGFAAAAYGCVRRLTKKARRALTIAALLVVFAVSGSPLMDVIVQRFEQGMYTVIQRQKNFARIDDSGYLIYPAHCYQRMGCSAGDIFRAYLKGVYYTLFAPFPWRMESKQQLMAYPQVLLWYIMLPLIIYGFYLGFRINRTLTAIFFIYTVIVFSILALVEGNVGALFRHRDMVTPFLLIYFGAAVGKLSPGLF